MVVKIKTVDYLESELTKVRVSRDAYLRDKISVEALNKKYFAEYIKNQNEIKDQAELIIRLGESNRIWFGVGVGTGILVASGIVYLLK